MPKNNEDSGLLSFRTTSPDATFVREKLLEEPNRYFNDARCLRRPADVTDKLRKAHGRLVAYNRDSMKGGMARILKEDDLREAIVRWFERHGVGGGAGGAGGAGNGGGNDDDDDNDIVSLK